MHISMVYCANKLHNSHTTGNQSIPLLCLGSATTVYLLQCEPATSLHMCVNTIF